MRVRLENRLIRKLIRLPESGMGYQRVNFRLADGRELRDVLVFNAEEAELAPEDAKVGIVDLAELSGSDP
jgi:hypothetical protein